jgi:type IV pilus assembly protein PilE
MKYPHRSSLGFSIVELMIVVAIVAILAAVAIPAYHNHIMRSRQADAYHNLLDIKAAQEMFFSMEDAYAGPFSPLPDSNTYTKMLSFPHTDTTYYVYHITAASDTAFTAMAMGKYKKLSGNNIRITENEDPCMCTSGALKQSLGLADCSPACP